MFIQNYQKQYKKDPENEKEKQIKRNLYEEHMETNVGFSKHKDTFSEKQGGVVFFFYFISWITLCLRTH